MKRKLSITLVGLAALGTPLAATAATVERAGAVRSGEVKIKGTITAIGKQSLTVANARRALTFSVPARISLATFDKGDTVEAEGARRNGGLVLRELEHEDRVDGALEARHGHGDDDKGGDDNGGRKHGNDDHGGDDHGGHGHDDGPNHH